jgi:cyclohexanecarboxylate-CoA ligase
MWTRDVYVQLGYWKNENIYQYLEESTALKPEKIAVVDQHVRYTYAELLAQVQRLAGALKSIGIGKGDVVSFQLPNWAESVVIHQALAMIGAVSNPIIPIYRQKEVRYILSKSNAKVLFIPCTFRRFHYPEMIRSLMSELPQLEHVIIVDKYREQPSGLHAREQLYDDFINLGTPCREMVKVDEKDVALLLFTSGTTADPKGVLHTHNTLLHENLFHLDQEDVIFMPSPVTHITGIIVGLELPFIIRGRVVFQEIWDPETAVELILQEGCSFTVAASPFLKGIVETLKESDRKRLRFKAFACGGADVPPELVKRASASLNCFVTRVYGSSEFPTVSACGPHDPVEKAAFTDGRLLEGISAKVINDAGEEVPRGVVGELAVKGPEMFLGYLQEEFNEDAFAKDGFFLTGDLAVMDEEGYIEIKGRKKDIIIRGGENISVKEVEDLLFQHPKISQVAVVAMPDEKLGEKACAFVVLKQGTSMTLREMADYLAGQGIAKQKIPERLEIVTEMPMTASGKIQKYILRENIRQKLKAETLEKTS